MKTEEQTTNEDAEEFANLNKDVLPADWRTIKYWRAYHKACDIIRGSLGLDDGLEHASAWDDFRGQMLGVEVLEDFWQSEKFRWGVWLVCKLIDDLNILNYNYGRDEHEERENKNRKTEVAERFIGDCKMGDDHDHHAVLELIDYLNSWMKLMPEEDWEMAPEDVYDILNDLQTIARAQMMVLEVAMECKPATAPLTAP